MGQALGPPRRSPPGPARAHDFLIILMYFYMYLDFPLNIFEGLGLGLGAGLGPLDPNFFPGPDAG